MKQSQLLIPTLREAPADAELVSHKLMIRAGYVRKLAAGLYSFLPLALRVMRKIEGILREELTREGAQELLLPIVMPAELWQETGRWTFYGKELLRFKDRHEREFCLGPTHEEAVTDLVRQTVSSYRQLPLNLFQIQTKFRDEIRPRFGLMRGREFVMKDGYSFDVDEAGALVTYDKMYRAYTRIFERCGLDFRPVEAMTGAIGGSRSHEFQVLAQSGEDCLMVSDAGNYAANVEKAPLDCPVDLKNISSASGKTEKVHTPGTKSVEALEKFFQVPAEKILKTLIYRGDQGLIAVLLRGDHELMEEKLKTLLKFSELTLATPQEITQAGTVSGYVGPIGLNLPIYADFAVAAMQDFIAGAGEADQHWKGVNLGDFKVQGFHDLRRARPGDACPQGGAYQEYRGIEVGHVFYLGTKYSEKMRANYKDEQGGERPIVMGCYGIGVSRTAAAAIEQNHDENGIVWPYPIAPFHFHLLSLQMNDEKVVELSQKIYDQLRQSGIEVLWDERNENPGVKFKDGDLIGIPHRIVVGGKGLAEGIVELKSRKTGEVQKIPVDQIFDAVFRLHEEARR